MVRRLMADRPGRVDLMVLPKNVGKAEAVRVGLLEAIERGSAIVGYLDADLATPASEMLRLIEIAEQQPQRTAVLGSRVALLGHTVRRRPMRHYLGRLYATAASLALGVAVYDTQCGAKVFRVGTPLQLALADPFPDRWSFDVELLGRLLADPRQHADPVLEVPLREWRDVSGSSVGAASGMQALWALTGLRRRVRHHRRRYG
jgi:glycosyltransferase involved in cell wall biosynthesis